MTNLQEYLAGTNPRDPSSSLRLDVPQVTPTQVAIQFNAVAGHTYSLLLSTDLSGGWVKLVDVAAQPVDGPVRLADTAASGAPARFYRLITPALP